MFLDKHARLLAGVLAVMALAPQASAAPWSRWYHGHPHGSGDRGDHASTPSLPATPSSEPTGIFSIQPVQPSSVYSARPTLEASPSAMETPSASAVSISSGSAKGEVMIPYYVYPGAGKWDPVENL